jgi:hypothetical protein
MKKQWILLIGFLLFTCQPFPCGAETKVRPTVKPSSKVDLVQLSVAKGDYLINICKQYLDTENRWKEVARINHLKDPRRLQPGVKIMVPAAYLKGMPVDGRVTFVQGEARAQIGGRRTWTTLKMGDPIPPGSQLKTGSESALEVTYEDGSVFFLRSDTEVGVLKAQKTLTLHQLRDFYLGTGRMVSKVREATGEASRFKIHSPSAVASVRGTEFRVAVDDAQKTFTEVMESRVTVAAANKSVELTRGEGTVVKKGQPPLPPRKLLEPPSPLDLKTIYNKAPAIAFTPVDNAQAYRIMVANDKEGKHLLREKIIKPRETFEIAGSADGAYHLLTLSIDPIGLEGIPSAAYPFKIRVNPLPPITQSPRESAKIKGKTATFAWLSVSDAVRYHVQISEDREFSKLSVNKADLTGTTFKADTLEYKPYFFRISSIAKDGYQGAWSDPLPFTLTPLPPTPTVDQPVVSKEEINLRSRSVGEGYTYHFQIAKDNQFKDILIDQKLNKPEITAKKPKDAGTYFVRTAAIDREGDAGEFSAPQSFEIEAGFPYAYLGGGLGVAILLLILAH